MAYDYPSPAPTTRKLNLEVAVFNRDAAFCAQALGAARIELNAKFSYKDGGLTPSVDDLRLLRAGDTKITIPIRIVIRHHICPGRLLHDYVYKPHDIDEMKASIVEFKAAGLMNPFLGDGFVFGALRESETIDPQMEGDVRAEVDEDVCRQLVEAARPYPCIFSRAFDRMAETPYSVREAEKLVALGFEGILTAGAYLGGCCYPDNTDDIDVLCRRMDGKLQIIAGGGVHSTGLTKTAEQLAVYGDETICFQAASIRHDDAGEPTNNVDATELNCVLSILDQVTPAKKDPAAHWRRFYNNQGVPYHPYRPA